LAGRYSIKIPEKPLNPAQKKIRDDRKKDVWIMNLVQGFFIHNLRQRGDVAKNEVLKRGYDPSIIEKEGLGFSPEGWDDLPSFLTQKGVDLARAEKLGLIISRPSGGTYGRFRKRLTFPIYDVKSDLVGFGARSLDPKDKAKYLNSSEGPLYKKSYSLYRIDKAKEPLRKMGFAILTEGYFDALAFVASGYPNVVASCGTAFTLEQAKIFRRYTPKILTAFDGDQAGMKATVQAFSYLSELRISHFVVPFPEKEDPDSVWQKGGKKAVENQIKEAQPFLDFILSHLLEFSHKGLRQKTTAIKRMAEILAQASSPLEQELYRQKAAHAFGVPQNMIQMEKKQASRKMTLSTKGKALEKSSHVGPEEVLLGIMIHEPSFMSQLSKGFVERHFQDDIFKKLAIELIDKFSKGKEVTISEFLEDFPQIPLLTLRASEYIDAETVDKVFKDCVQRLQSQRVSRDREKLIEDLYKAEKKGDHNHAHEVLQKLQSILEEQRELS